MDVSRSQSGGLTNRKILLFANTDWYLFNFRLSLIRAARADGADVVLVAPPGPYAAKLKADGFRCIEVPMMRRSLNPWREVRLIWALCRLYRRERPDIVHHFTIKCVVYGGIAARLAAVPATVNAVTGMGFVFNSTELLARALRPFVRTLLRWTMSARGSKLVVQNSDDLRVVTTDCGVDSAHVQLIASSGVDTERFRPSLGRPREKGEETRILLASRLLRDKGLLEFVAAARILRARGVSAQFVVAGGPDPGNPVSISQSEIAAWCNEGVLTYLGHVDDIVPLLASAHVFVLPSYGEGVPKGLIEAAAVGLPLVTTRVPGCTDVVEHGLNGFVVPVKDAVALAAAIVELVESPALAERMGLASRVRAIEKFDERIVLAKTIEVYRKMLSECEPRAMAATAQGVGKSATKVLLFANTDWYLFNFCRKLASGIRDEGGEVVLVSPPGPHVEDLQAMGFRWVAMPMSRRSFNLVEELGTFVALWQLYRRERPDIVNNYTIKSVVYGGIAARLAGVRAVVNSITGLGYVFSSQDWFPRLLRPFVIRLLAFACNGSSSRLVVLNPDDRRTLVEYGIADQSKVWVIAGAGVDTEVFRPRAKPRKRGIPASVVFAGRLLREKGLHDYLRAAMALRAEGCDARFFVAGEGDSGNPGSLSKEELDFWRNEGSASFLGQVKNMPELLASADMVVLPSYGEGVPTSLIEAASCGLPIVTTDVPGCREVVEDGINGYMVPKCDSGALADAVRKLVKDPELAERMGAAGRQLALHKFDASLIVAETIAVFRELVPVWHPRLRPEDVASPVLDTCAPVLRTNVLKPANTASIALH